MTTPTPGAADEPSIAAMLSVIGDRWTLLILRDLFRGVVRFGQLVDDLGIAKNLLSDRLKKLADADVIERVPYQDRPVRYEYRLTAKGRALSPSLIALMRWGDTYYPTGEPPVVLVHDACESTLEPRVHCPTCDRAVAPNEVRNRSDLQPPASS